VGALVATADGFACAGYDGKLRLYADGKEKSVVDLGAHVKLHAIDVNGGKFLCGSVGNSISEVSLDTMKPETLMTGHSNEVWGLAVNPKHPVVVTGGWDQVVRIWDYSKKAFVPGKTLRVKSGVQSATWHPDGSHFAIGLKDGKVEVYALEGKDGSLEVKHSHEFSKDIIECLAYSPDGKHLVAGTWDQAAYVIDTATFKLHKSLKGHSSSILQVTWSSDSKHIVTNSKDYEILYWSAETGKKVTEAVVVDTDWDKWSCILGWPVVGVFREGSDGTDVNSAAVSDAKDEKSDYRVVATSDDFGKVNLYRYPALKPKCPMKSFDGHSSHVTRVRFNADATYVFSTGGNDLSLFQWKHVQDSSN
jgi:microtubule-associated protein-like 1/2